MKQPFSRRLKIETLLYMLKAFAPIASVVFVEQQMGPGSDSKAVQIMAPLLTLNLILGSLSIWNLLKVFRDRTFNKFVGAEVILGIAKAVAPFLLMFAIEATTSLGGRARSAQLFPIHLIINVTLGMWSLMNVARAIASVNDDENEEITDRSEYSGDAS